MASSTEVLAGLVDRVTFHNADNGFCVLRVKARGQRDSITVVGHTAMVSAGEFVQASGAWINDRTHGVQFRATFLKATAPTTVEGIEKYLGSGMIRGIGPVYAKKLVRAFGGAVLDVIEQEPGRLRDVTGIGPKRAQRIIAGWAEQKVIREIMLFLHSNGVGTSRAVRIYKTYGADAIRLISENPYRLARDIRGIGFRTADQVAGKLGIEKTALIRVSAGISFALAEAMDDGHCGLPAEELVPLTQKLIEVPVELITTALDLELQNGTVIAGDLDGRCCIFLAGLYHAEQEIAEKLRALTAGEPPWPSINAEKAIPWVEKRTKLALADSQTKAIRVALASKVVVITGGPGVGKTTLVNSLLKILLAKAVVIALCAPTGRAAKRLSESTGLEAKTIHRLLETDPRTGAFRRNEEEPLGCDLLVVDETSMVDVPLMGALLRALPNQAALLLVGDVDQLPSVGPGQVLADIIASGAVPVVRLRILCKAVEMSLADWWQQTAVNLDGVFLSVKYAVPAMRRVGGGSIIIMSSVAGLRGSVGLAGYCATKGGVRLFAKAVAMECAAAGDGVRINTVHPGVIDTPIWTKISASAGSNAPIDPNEVAGAGVPLGRAGQAQDIANGVLFLASDASSYMTGAELVIDGGMTGGTRPRWSFN